MRWGDSDFSTRPVKLVTPLIDFFFLPILSFFWIIGSRSELNLGLSGVVIAAFDFGRICQRCTKGYLMRLCCHSCGPRTLCGWKFDKPLDSFTFYVLNETTWKLLLRMSRVFCTVFVLIYCILRSLSICRTILPTLGVKTLPTLGVLTFIIRSLWKSSSGHYYSFWKTDDCSSLFTFIRYSNV